MRLDRDRPDDEIPTSSMADIAFLLIVFFMVTTTFTATRGLDFALPEDDDDPSWSPDSKRIAFVSDRDGNNEIYMMDANGGNQRNITKNPYDDAAPEWFGPAFAVASVGKQFTMWGWIKQVVR